MSVAYLPDSHKVKKILTIHSKGPFVKEILDYYSHNKFYIENINYFGTLENNGLEKADIITFPSESSKELFSSNSSSKSFHHSDMIIVYNGVDIKHINSIKSDKDLLLRYGITGKNELMILNVAQHVKPKNITLLIEAMNVLVNQIDASICLINAGDGAETEKLRKMISYYHLQNNVKLLGRLPNERIIMLMKACDIFIMPSERVVFDMVILEAMACGCCIIASDEGGNKEIIKNGENGYLLNEISVEEIVDKILNVNRKITGINAIEYVKNYSRERMVREYEKIYSIL